jgi:hypothetical protein
VFLLPSWTLCWWIRWTAHLTDILCCAEMLYVIHTYQQHDADFIIITFLKHALRRRTVVWKQLQDGAGWLACIVTTYRQHRIQAATHTYGRAMPAYRSVSTDASNTASRTLTGAEPNTIFSRSNLVSGHIVMALLDACEYRAAMNHWPLCDTTLAVFIHFARVRQRFVVIV